MSPSPDLDLVLVFRTQSQTLSKQEAIEEAQQALKEYRSLLETLSKGGLKATGRRGVSQGQVIILVYAPWKKIQQLAQMERHSDFLLGLPTCSIPSHARNFGVQPLSGAERIRLVHSYITATIHEGGLGAVPGAPEWPRLESVMALHDHEFNDAWMHSWTHRQFGFGIKYAELTKIKDQFGESVALYFAFLSGYTKSLIFPAIFGTICFVRGRPYDPLYSTIVVAWSIVFIEWWRVRERILGVRWGSYGSFRVEKRRPQFRGDERTSNIPDDAFPWWKREVRTICSIPVIMIYAAILILLLTAIFVFEAFVTQLYTGPGHRYASFSPTVLFIALVPRLLSLYHSSAVSMTNWENHPQQSSYDYSLTIKTFALSGLVAYSGLALSAFVYVPFHEHLMTFIHTAIFSVTSKRAGKGGMFEANLYQARAKVNPSRLQDQMFAFTVTNQIISFGLEVVLPFVLRKADSVKSNGLHLNGKKKRVGFDDEDASAKEEREFLDNVRHQVALPEHTLFGEYSEMATQFGYVAAWSTIWPLAPFMAFLNNWFEARGDALKIVKHCRRPLPQRADSIGPWLEALGFITWLAALTNSALVYLFEPRSTGLASVFGGKRIGTTLDDGFSPAPTSTELKQAASFGYQSVLVLSLLIALSSSHAYLVARLLIRHVVLRAYWKGSPEERRAKEGDREVKQLYLRTLRTADTSEGEVIGSSVTEMESLAFWDRDDGLEEVTRGIKEA